jgi:hypothetical protein
MWKKPLLLWCAAACLLAAWFWGGGYARRDGAAPPPTPDAVDRAAPAPSDAAETPAPAATAAAHAGGSAPTPAAPIETPETPLLPTAPPGTSDPPAAAAHRPTDPPAMSPAPPSDPAAAPAAVQDPYLTDPVPADKPPPVEPQAATPGGNTYTCTLSVRCDTLLDNLASLDPEKHELVPADGVIFPATAVTFSEGENAFTLLQREMRRARIHLEFVHTPLYNSAYIEGIHNLYEFDAGELSGWMYSVNGWFPNYGCSRYLLQDGDAVAFVYTCDLGRDVGGGDVGLRIEN